MIDAKRVYAWVHTWWGRDGVQLPFRQSLDESDAAGWVQVERQPKGFDRDEFFLHVLKKAHDRGFEYTLRLEDDVRVNKHLAHNVLSWPAACDEAFGLGMLSTCDRVKKLVPVRKCEHAGSWEFDRHGYHFGGGWIARTTALIANLHRIREILDAIKRLNGRFGPTTSVADALVDSRAMQHWRLFVHEPALVEIDLTIDSHQMTGDLAKRYGKQPFDADWRRP